MIIRDDILSMEYLKKTEYTGCHKGMRYRLEGATKDEKKCLKVTVWPEPFNFFTTPPEEKQTAYFDFEEDGIVDAVGGAVRTVSVPDGYTVETIEETLNEVVYKYLNLSCSYIELHLYNF